MQMRSVLCGVLTGVILVATAAEVSADKPWPLRDHYTFKGNAVNFMVDARTAEWRAVTVDGQEIIELAYTEIVLGDGRVARLSKDTWTTDGRDEFSDGFGDGTRFRSEYRPFDDVHVEHHVNRYTDQSFVTIMIVVKNTSAVPLSLKSIRMGVMDEGYVHLVQPARLHLDHTARRGNHLVPSKTNRATLAEFRAPGTSDGIFGIGLLQSGYMQSSLNFEKGKSGWSGTIASTFNPAIDIAPGKSAQSDALWVMFSATDSIMLHDIHGWAKGFVMPERDTKVYPNAWITVPSTSDSKMLMDAAGKSGVQGLNRVLVPAGWPSADDNMGLPELATALRRKRMIPGLTVDPLLVGSKSKGLTIMDTDGSYWIDLREAEAREHGIKQLRKIVNWKYGFFAVARSGIPDSVLDEMNISRAVADVVAFELMEEAAGVLPVMPTADLFLGNDEEEWTKLTKSTRANREFQVRTGPTRLTVDGIESLDPGVLDALESSVGPIEIVGSPSKEVKKQLGAILAVSADVR